MKKKSNFKRLMQYAGGHKYLTYTSWILSVLSALTALVPFIYIWLIIKEVLEIMPNFSRGNNMIHYGFMAVVFAVLSMIIYICGLMCSHLSAFRVAANMRRDCLNHIVKLPLGSVEGIGSGKLRKIVMDSSAATETYLAHRLPDKAGAIATPVGLLAMLLFFDCRLGILSLVPAILGFFIMTRMTGAKMEQKMKEYQDALADMSNEAVEYVRGIPVVKTFGQTVFSFRRFRDSIQRYERWAIAYTKDLRMPMMIYTTAINAVFAFIIAGSILLTQKGVTGELLVNILFYIIITPVITTTLTKLMFMSEDAMIVNDAVNRIDEVFSIEPLPATQKPDIPMDNSVVLENVSYSYDGVKDALHNVSLSIKPGEITAFVGPSGGGKSTMAGIISRFFDPQKGRILIGGVNIKDIKKSELMNTISFVFQDSKLIKKSIFENVRMARPTASRDEVMEALKKAQCMDIIEKLPQGMDTVIGTKGNYLSGGEQQRIAIARAVLKNAPIIILDEATAFADPDNEVLVQKAFTEMVNNKTVIMIAHRLTTVQNANCIYVLKEGKIEEYGSHNSLIEKGGLYSHMWSEYNSSINWKVGEGND